MLNYHTVVNFSNKSRIHVIGHPFGYGMQKSKFADLIVREHIPTGKTNKKTGEPITKSEMKYKNASSIQALKDRLAAKYSIAAKTILMKATGCNYPFLLVHMFDTLRTRKI
jgi:hypothetical protein